MAEWSASRTSPSTDPGFMFLSDHYLVLFHGSPEFKSSATLVNSQLVCLRPVGIRHFKLFVSVVCWDHLVSFAINIAKGKKGYFFNIIVK